MGAVGRNLSLRSVLEAALINKNNWRVFVTFCEDVMAKKKQAERERQRAPVLPKTSQTLTRGAVFDTLTRIRSQTRNHEFRVVESLSCLTLFLSATCRR